MMTIPPEQMNISDETKLADLTVGEFKQLIQSLLQNAITPVTAITNPVIETSSDVDDSKKMSLDELMNDLEG